MDTDTQIEALSAKLLLHREFLETEEAAKMALVVPLLGALGYDTSDPSEVRPEFTCDVASRRGEKVDYAICNGDKINILIECKPISAKLSLDNAHQLIRYFNTQEARLAVLTNGLIWKFYSDTERTNRMDEKPFYEFNLERPSKADYRILSHFEKQTFDIEKVVKLAEAMKSERAVMRSLEAELETPSDDFVKLIAREIHDGKRMTAQIVDRYRLAIQNAAKSIIRKRVLGMLDSTESQAPEADINEPSSEIETTDIEIEGFHIVRAIGSQCVAPSRIVMRDAKSYCAILLDDNNRKPIVRLRFNSESNLKLGIFAESNDEVLVDLDDPQSIYQSAKAINDRIKFLSNN